MNQLLATNFKLFHCIITNLLQNNKRVNQYAKVCTFFLWLKRQKNDKETKKIID